MLRTFAKWMFPRKNCLRYGWERALKNLELKKLAIFCVAKCIEMHFPQKYIIRFENAVRTRRRGQVFRLRLCSAFRPATSGRPPAQLFNVFPLLLKKSEDWNFQSNFKQKKKRKTCTKHWSSYANIQNVEITCGMHEQRDLIELWEILNTRQLQNDLFIMNRVNHV